MNEGFLPKGKEVGLPVFTEKDAIFAYHFYRLIQKCKSVSLVYNTEINHIASGEKSRFITQLDNELTQRYRSKIIFNENVCDIVK